MIENYKNYGTCDSCDKTEVINVLYFNKPGFHDEIDLCDECITGLHSIISKTPKRVQFKSQKEIEQDNRARREKILKLIDEFKKELSDFN